MYFLIDNYDSFTYNLHHYLQDVGCKVDVVRNDVATAEDLLAHNPTGFILSPGPCTPNEAGICLDLLATMPETMPVFGVCLGHQAIGQHFGGTVERAPYVMHGKTSDIHHDATGVFADIPEPFTATRYHSLTVDASALSSDLVVNARTADGMVMGLRHRSRPVHGVQFHPESIASEYGHKLLKNFISIAEAQ